MHRRGQIPVVKYGYKLYFSFPARNKEKSSNQTTNKKNDESKKQLDPEALLDSKQVSVKDRPVAIPSQNQSKVNPPMSETSIRPMSQPSDNLISPKFLNMIQTSTVKLWSTTCKIGQTLPTRLQK